MSRRSTSRPRAPPFATRADNAWASSPSTPARAPFSPSPRTCRPFSRAMARNTILLLAHYEKLLEEAPQGTWTTGLIKQGAAERLLPVIMTAVLTALGLVPLAASLGTAGNEIEGPLAIAVLGGLASSTVLC